MPRIVAIADTHLYHEDLPELPAGDILIHAGDLLQRGDLEELERGLSWLESLPHPHKILVAGNHDVCFEKHPVEARAMVPDSILYLEDSEAEVLGLRIYGSPWQPAYNEWGFNLPRGEQLAAKWAMIPEGIDVLITHGPPAGYGDKEFVPGRGGCKDLLGAIDRARPKLHLYGHIHHAGGCWARQGMVLANVTTWESERAASVFDIESASITPIEVPPAET